MGLSVNNPLSYFTKTGTYTGDGNPTQLISIGFKPKMVFIYGENTQLVEAISLNTTVSMFQDGISGTLGSYLTLGTTSFTVDNVTLDINSLNDNGITYYWGAVS